jgi:hypothetical protein
MNNFHDKSCYPKYPFDSLNYIPTKITEKQNLDCMFDEQW